MRMTVLSTLCIAALGGCAGSTDTAVTDPCDAQGYTSLLGSNIAAITLPADLNDRVVGPNDVVTTDFDEGRLNIETNADGLIIGLSCG